MFLQIIRVSVIEIEVFHKRKLARPQVHLMFRVTQMISKTACKVSGSKDQDFRDMSWRGMVRIHRKLQRLYVSCGEVTRRINRLEMIRMVWERAQEGIQAGLCCTSGPDGHLTGLINIVSL